MQLATKKILVTGADGFIGSHLTEELVRLGCDVRAFVMYNAFNSWGWFDSVPRAVKQSIEVFAGDIRDPFSVKTAMCGCDVVMHLAALIAIPYSYRSPESYVDTNVRGTLNVLQAARELETAKVVQTSTSEVYGTARYVPIDEEHPLQAQSPYSATKIAADQLAMPFHASFSLPIAIIRPFNTYGPRQSARAVLPTVITQIAAGQRELHLGALHPTRDFNYVKDTVAGFIEIAQSEAAIGRVINIGSNYEISIGDVARMIAQLMGAEVEFRTDEARLRPTGSEVERLWADNTLAQTLLGWRPAYQGMEGLRRGLAETIEWFTNPQDLLNYKTEVYNI